jgi:hypothetical protein
VPRPRQLQLRGGTLMCATDPSTLTRP